MSISTNSPVPIHVCRWDWCRETFDTSDRLARHVLDDHVAKEIPVKREDIRLELRAFDGTSIGEDSIRTSLLMNETVSLGDEDKESEVPTRDGDHSPSPSIHQDAVVDDAEPEPRVVHELSIVIPESVAVAPDTFNYDDDRQPSPSSRAASRSRASSSFRELAASSSPSPDPDTMTIAPSPSLAELVAKTINRAHSSNHVEATDRLTPTPTSGLGKPSSSGGAGHYPCPQPAEEKRKSTVTPTGETSASASRPLTRSRSRTSSATSRKEAQCSVREAARSALSPIREVMDASVIQVGSHSDTQSSDATSASRPFRSGSIRLVPDPEPLREDGSSSLHADSTPQSQARPQLQNGLALPSESDILFNGASSYVDDISMLSSSLDPLIPAFTQVSDMQNQSQWPLATQAPYSIDSSLTFSSQ